MHSKFNKTKFKHFEAIETNYLCPWYFPWAYASKKASWNSWKVCWWYVSTLKFLASLLQIFSAKCTHFPSHSKPRGYLPFELFIYTCIQLTPIVQERKHYIFTENPLSSILWEGEMVFMIKPLSHTRKHLKPFWHST